MKLRFLGTRGEIDLRTPLHRMHTSMQVSYRKTTVMIDCGLDWLGQVKLMNPQAIVLTHAHPDHAWGLKEGAPCRVYATEVTWGIIESYPIEARVTVKPRTPFEIGAITFEAFPVEHSTRCPAVGYRITAGRNSIFYVPDLVHINEQHEALAGVRLYIGDGASLRRPMVRRPGNALVGHSAVRTQLGWCRKEGVPSAIVTHCGSEIVGGSPEAMNDAVRELGKEKGIEAAIAYDGLEVTLP